MKPFKIGVSLSFHFLLWSLLIRVNFLPPANQALKWWKLCLPSVFCHTLKAENVFPVKNTDQNISNTVSAQVQIQLASWTVLEATIPVPKGCSQRSLLVGLGGKTVWGCQEAWVPPSSWEAELPEQSGNCIVFLWGGLTLGWALAGAQWCVAAFPSYAKALMKNI